jgi:hypothetical protein
MSKFRASLSLGSRRSVDVSYTALLLCKSPTTVPHERTIMRDNRHRCRTRQRELRAFGRRTLQFNLKDLEFDADQKSDLETASLKSVVECHFRTSDCRPDAAKLRFGTEADILGGLHDVRFTPKSRHWCATVECPLCAKSALMHCSNRHRAYDRCCRIFASS